MDQPIEIMDEKVAMFFYGARAGSIEMVESFIARGVDVNSKDKKGFSALHLAVMARKNSYETASLLIEKGAEVDARSETGITPLHDAAAHGTFEVVELLLENGANPKALTHQGQSPVNWAASKEVIALLVRHGGIPKDSGSKEKDVAGTSRRKWLGLLGSKKKT